MDRDKLDSLREIGRRPVRITAGESVFIGDEEFPYPIEHGSIKVTKGTSRHNRLTLTLFVGEVTFEAEPKADS